MTSSNVDQQLGRAKNAMLEYLTHKLLLPKIYLDANWNSEPIDVLAIDRDGVGDVHAVLMVYRVQNTEIGNGELLHTSSKVDACVDKLKSIPCQYRYVAVVNDEPYARAYGAADSIIRKTLADDGVGRIGILNVDLAQKDVVVQITVKPERFRSSPKIIELADQYTAEHSADWEVRA